ncbi:MAG: hypothetical protein Kow0080_07340 [Candidatus Promineifilaceae bacterium]
MTKSSRLLPALAGITAVSLSIIGGLALSRVLYETFFPALAWLARPFPIIATTLLTATAGTLSWKKMADTHTPWQGTAVFLPLLLNLVYLPQTLVTPLRGQLFFCASIWATALLFTYVKWPAASTWRDKAFLLAFLIPVYTATLGQTVGKADTFEFQVVIPKLGIVHPTGYPLYLLLTKLFTLLPWGETAWRINVGTAVYALTAVTILYTFMRRLTGQNLTALFTALLFGLTPTFWSQATAAEVYTLHSLIVVAALYFMREIGGWQLAKNTPSQPKHSQQRIIALAFVLGLGLTNHLTTLILIPPALLTIFLARPFWHNPHAITKKSIAKNVLPPALAFLLPLTLYTYLPVRWQAIVGEPIGFGRFIDWVIGGRFQGALQLMAWLRDPVRYTVVGRLFTAEWGTFWLAAAALGFLWLLQRQWQAALVLFTAWLGYAFYALSYYVPDLNVFLIPAHLLTAVSIGTAAAFASHTLQKNNHHPPATLFSLLIMAVLLPTPATWTAVDQSTSDGLTQWGRAVLSLPLVKNAAILADSEKIAPLEYLHSAEGIRPDLDISVWPDEAAYRAQLEARLAAGQTVYLARFLPGLAGAYHLRSAGPLTEVGTAPLTALPETAVPTHITINGITLLGYELHPQTFAPNETAVTLYWQAAQPTNQPLHLYTRWQGGSPIPPAGQHPANNNYPTNAWKAGEIVPDFHLLPQPLASVTRTLNLQATFAPPFTPAADLNWQTVAQITVPPAQKPDGLRPYRAQLGTVMLDGAAFLETVRPGTPLSGILTGFGPAEPPIILTLVPEEKFTPQPPTPSQRTAHRPEQPFVWAAEVEVPVTNGRYYLLAAIPGETAVCGWLQAPTNACSLGQITVSGIPLPPDATNFDDKIALLHIDLPQNTLTPGGQLPVTLTWQALTPMTEDYTIFLQLLDANDQIVGQVDTWPLQGTYPTSQWQPGETITDPITIQLASNLPAGEYRLIVGWYLLADLRRLPVLDANGSPIADYYAISGLKKE